MVKNEKKNEKKIKSKSITFFTLIVGHVVVVVDVVVDVGWRGISGGLFADGAQRGLHAGLSRGPLPFAAARPVQPHRRPSTPILVHGLQIGHHLRLGRSVRAGRVLLTLRRQRLMIVQRGGRLHTSEHSRSPCRPPAEVVPLRSELGLQSLTLASEAARSAPERALLEHELRGRVDRPVVALSRSSQSFRQLDEAIVQGQIVPDRVLPPLVGAPEEGEALLQEGVDLAQGEPLGGRVLYGHDYEGYVRVWRLLLSPGSTHLLDQVV